MYLKGQGVTQDITEGAAWLRSAADQGYSHAQYNLGVMHVAGVGVAADDVEAADWYHRAAEQGHQSAQYNLGLMYYHGNGIAQDNVLAHMWASLAAASGHADAAIARDVIVEAMTATDFYESQEITRNCIERNFENCSRLAQ